MVMIGGGGAAAVGPVDRLAGHFKVHRVTQVFKEHSRLRLPQNASIGAGFKDKTIVLMGFDHPPNTVLVLQNNKIMAGSTEVKRGG